MANIGIRQAVRKAAFALISGLPYLVLLGWLAAVSWFLCDNAFISFRYVRNLLEGHGVEVFTAEIRPVAIGEVEGHSGDGGTIHLTTQAHALLVRRLPTERRLSNRAAEAYT